MKKGYNLWGGRFPFEAQRIDERVEGGGEEIFLTKREDGRTQKDSNWRLNKEGATANPGKRERRGWGTAILDCQKRVKTKGKGGKLGRRNSRAPSITILKL